MTLTYLDLTTEQRSSLDGLPFDGHHLISGPPGSGKSLLAVQRAVMLALTGTPTVLLTYSNLLRQSLAGAVHTLGPADRSVRVRTAHTWLAEWYGGTPPKSDDGWFDWPALFERVVEGGPVPGLTLVVDEGRPAARVLSPVPTPGSTDDGVRGRVPAVGRHELHTRRDRRAPRPVRPVPDRWQPSQHVPDRVSRGPLPHGSGSPPLPDRQGPPPRLHHLPERGAADLLVLLAERHPGRSIGVIVHSKHTQFSLLGTLKRRAPRLKPQLYTSDARDGRYRTLDLGRPGIVLVHRRSAKGLGFDTVVIPDTHADSAADPTSAALRMTYYVLATRARSELHLAYEGDVEPPLMAQVGSGVLLRG